MASDNISLSAVHPDGRKRLALKARRERLGLQLFVDFGGGEKVCIADPNKGRVVAVDVDVDIDDAGNILDDLDEDGKMVAEHPNTLRHAAERVIREYRDHDEFEVDGAAEGMLVRLRNKLALALDALENALTDATGQTAVAFTPESRMTNVERALMHIGIAERFTHVCGLAVREMACDGSSDVAHTMGDELWGALDDARKALTGEA